MLIRRILFITLLMALLGVGQLPGLASKTQVPESPIYFPGQLLVASPGMRDPRFRKSVIYMIEHNAGGAHGIIVNKILGQKRIASLMKNFGLDSRGATGSLDLHFGGPVNPRGAFILHTSDYKDAKSRSVDGTISFTLDIGILRAIADGKSPKRVLLALGYAGWGAGQLGDEVARGDWSLADATEELVFGDGSSDVWERIVGSSQVPL
jgi:putative transcriptional regulator